MKKENGFHYLSRELEAMSVAQNYNRWIVSEFSPYLGETVAEVGAGTGNFSRFLLETDIKHLVAYEPSDNMFPLLKDNLSHDLRAEAVNGYFMVNSEARKYDSIVYVNVLEHIEKDKDEVCRASEALNMKGHLLLFVPALMWLFSNFDREVGHYRRYLKKDLIAIVEAAGLTVFKAKYFDSAGIIPWYINFVLLKNPMKRGGVTLYDNTVVPVLRLFERSMPPLIGKNIVLVARKD